MDYTQYLQYLPYVGYLVVFGLILYTFNMRSKVVNSVGWNFINSYSKTRINKNKDLLLRIKSPSGKEYYEAVKQSPIIKYKYMENNKNVEKQVIYDPKAVATLNGISVMNVTPADIRPLDADLGTLVNVPSEVILNLISNSTKDPKTEENKAKHDKMLIYGLIGMGLLMIVGLSYLGQNNMETMDALRQCTIDAGKSATVTPNN